MQVIIWQGQRKPEGQVEVFMNGVPFGLVDEALPIDGPWQFDWNNDSRGARLLALAILMELLPLRKAMQLYQEFLYECVLRLPHDAFLMTRQDVVAWLLTKEVAWELVTDGPGPIIEIRPEPWARLQPIDPPARM